MSEALGDELLTGDGLSIALVAVRVHVALGDEIVTLGELCKGRLRTPAVHHEVVKRCLLLREAAVGIALEMLLADTHVQTCFAVGIERELRISGDESREGLLGVDRHQRCSLVWSGDPNGSRLATVFDETAVDIVVDGGREDAVDDHREDRNVGRSHGVGEGEVDRGVL